MASFVPYSVTMRALGYVRVPRTQRWIPAGVYARQQWEAEADRLGQPLREMMRTDPVCLALQNGVPWGELADAEDEVFLDMTEEQWHAHLCADKSQSVEEVNRIRRRRQARAAAAASVPESDDHGPAYWYSEYTRFPMLYFSSQHQQLAALQEVLADWRVSTGRWRISRLDAAARKIQTAWRNHTDRDDRESFLSDWSTDTPALLWPGDPFCGKRLVCRWCSGINEDHSGACKIFESPYEEDEEYDDRDDYDEGCEHCHSLYCDTYECRYPREPEEDPYAPEPPCPCGDPNCVSPGQCGQFACGCIDTCRCS